MVGEDSSQFPGLGKPGPQPTDTDLISSMMQGDAQYLALRANLDQADELYQNAKAYRDAVRVARFATTAEDMKAVDNVNVFASDSDLSKAQRSAADALTSASNRVSSARAQLGSYETAFRQRAVASDNQRSGQMVTVNGKHYYVSVDSKGNTKSAPVEGLPDATVAGAQRQPISITSVDATGKQTITFYNPDTLKPYTSDGKPVSIDVGPAQANYNTSQSVEYLGAGIAPGGQAGFYKVRRGADGKIVQVPSADGSGQRIDAEFVSARPAPQVATSYVMSDGQGAGLITWDPTADNGKGAYTTQSIKIDDPGARDKFVADLRSRDLANQLAEINLANARYDATTKQVVGLPMAKAALRTANANADKGELEVIKARSDQLWDLRKRYVLDLHAKGLISEKQAYDYMADQASYQKQVMEREKAALDARKAALDEQRTLAEEERATGARFHTFGWAAGRTLDQQVALEKQIREQAKPGETSGQTIRRQQGMALSTDVKVPGQYQAPETTAAQQAWAKSHPDVFAGPEWETWLANYRNSVDALSGSSTPARSSSALTRPMGDQSWRDRANDPQVPLNDSPGWTSGLANNPATMAPATQMPSELAQWQALASGGAPAGAVAVPSPITGMQAPVANPYDDFTSWLQRQRQVPASMQYPAAAGVDAIA